MTTSRRRVHRARRLHNRTFDDALAVVTGAGSGIGAATAQALARRGARVLLLDIDHESAEDQATAINAAGGWAKSLLADVTDRRMLEALAADIVEAHGPIDIVINNAGVGMSGAFADMSDQDWDWIRSINLDGVINGCAAFGTPMVRNRSGHVVNVSSGLAYVTRASEPAYVTTKAAVLAFSRCLRADWGRHGVGVSAICPGVINTPIFESTRLLGAQASEATQRRGRRIFRLGHSPDKVGDAICQAIARDRGVVPVGWESHLGWATNGLTPSRIDTTLARLRIV